MARKKSSGKKRAKAREARPKAASKSKRKVSSKKSAKKPRSTKKTSKAVSKSKASKPVKASSKFNLIVSFDPNHIGSAEKELNEVLTKIGEKPKITSTEVEGLFKVAVSDARKVVGRLINLCKADPNMFVVTHNYTPIDNWCKSELADMQKRIKSLESGIDHSDRWKMNLSKRHWKKMDGTQLIVKLTNVVDRKNVDLTTPQKIVQVEIIGKEAGISLLKPNETLNVPKLKGEA